MSSKPNSYWQRRKESRKRWSLNAVRAKARIKAERLAEPILDEPLGNVFIPKRGRLSILQKDVELTKEMLKEILEAL